MPDLSIIIVSWNVKELLQRCLESIFQHPLAKPLPENYERKHKSKRMQNSVSRRREASLPSGLQFEVIVVDNASTDGSAAMVSNSFPQVQLLVSSKNLGFTVANNQAIARSQGRYVLLLNPDTEILGDALATIVGYMDGHPEVGALGPQLLNPDGSIQSSRRRFPTMATAFLESTVLQRWFPDNRVLKRYYMFDQAGDRIQEVDWVVGAALLVRREALEQVGLLDEGFFMYSEELDWCRRAKAQGWRVVYLPTAQVVHYGAQSSEQVKPFQHIQFQRSKVRYFRKHHGAWKAEALHLFLLVTYVYQLLEEAFKWLLGHKRPLRAARVKAYLEVLRSGLR